MDATISITDQDVVKEEPLKLVSPINPTPLETIFLSNIDQAVTFPVETVFFFELSPSKSSLTLNVSEKIKKAVAEKLLVPYYFMAGRLNFSRETKRLELLCNNAGVLFVSATSRLKLKDLGNLSLPNSTFHHFIHRPGLYKGLAETALFTVQAMLTHSPTIKTKNHSMSIFIYYSKPVYDYLGDFAGHKICMWGFLDWVCDKPCYS